MAYENQGKKITAIAGANLALAQYHFVMISADNTVVQCAAVTDIPCGVLQNNPAAGLAAEVQVDGITKILAGAAPLVAGNLIGTAIGGAADVIDPDGANDLYYCGQVIQGAGAGEIASALINCATPVIQSGS